MSGAPPQALLTLRAATPAAWLTAVLESFDVFLLDHASNERKASASALALVSHYPDRRELVDAMIELAREELAHFQQIVRLLHERGLALGAERKDDYVGQLRQHVRAPSDAYFLDRLLLGAVVEARGCERFGLLAQALPAGQLRALYTELARSEARHRDLFVALAELYFPTGDVQPRLDELLAAEARILASLPIQPALH